MPSIGPIEVLVLFLLVAVPVAAVGLVLVLSRASTRTSPEVPPPGWYPDPSASGGWRYWDGRQWHAPPR